MKTSFFEWQSRKSLLRSGRKGRDENADREKGFDMENMSIDFVVSPPLRGDDRARAEFFLGPFSHWLFMEWDLKAIDLSAAERHTERAQRLCAPARSTALAVNPSGCNTSENRFISFYSPVPFSVRVPISISRVCRADFIRIPIYHIFLFFFFVFHLNRLGCRPKRFYRCSVLAHNRSIFLILPCFFDSNHRLRVFFFYLFVFICIDDSTAIDIQIAPRFRRTEGITFKKIG